MIHVVALTGVTAMFLTACSTGPGAASADGEGAGADEPLIVYTNSNADGRAEWLTEQASEAGFNIEVVGQGGGDTTNKILAEQGNPVADVVFGLNHMYFEQLEAADTLVPYTPAWAEQVDPALADDDDEKSYWPVVQQGIVLAYNAGVHSPEEAPQDWTELWNEERFHGRYQTETGLGGATTQLVFAGILDRYRDDSGELGVSAEGWEQIEGYFTHGSPAEPEVDLYARMAQGEVDMGQMWTSGIPGFEEQYEVDSDVMRPEIGVPYAVEQAAIVAGTEQQDRAQEFIDWFGGAQTQAAWSAEFDSMPANDEAIAEADPEIVEFHESLTQQDIDWAFVQEHMGEWIEKIELEYVN
jgi:iron(III) transport system substrate-binding protein